MSTEFQTAHAQEPADEVAQECRIQSPCVAGDGRGGRHPWDYHRRRRHGNSIAKDWRNVCPGCLVSILRALQPRIYADKRGFGQHDSSNAVFQIRVIRINPRLSRFVLNWQLYERRRTSK